MFGPQHVRIARLPTCSTVHIVRSRTAVRYILNLYVGNLSISETVDEVIVQHANGLHMRIYNGGTDEAESPALEILAERVGLGGRRRNLPHLLPSIDLGASIDEPPAIGVKTSELFLNCQKLTRVTDGGFDFQPVANDRRIQYELL